MVKLLFMTKSSVEQLIPDRVRQSRFQIFPTVDTVVVEDSLAITAEGLERYPKAFSSKEAFFNHANDAFYNASFLRGSPFLRVPLSHPDMLIKKDLAHLPIATLLTLANLGRQVPLETDDYVFQPIGLFWAASFEGPVSLIAMENVDIHPVFDQAVHRSMIRGIYRLDEEARRVNLGTSRNPQDFLYRGRDSQGRPILTIIDQVNPDIFNLLK